VKKVKNVLKLIYLFIFIFLRSENKGRRGEVEFQTGLISGFLSTLAMLIVPAWSFIY
jgi:hypothetical protein